MFILTFSIHGKIFKIFDTHKFIYLFEILEFFLVFLINIYKKNYTVKKFKNFI